MHQIHRDLKPENILVNKLGDIKLTDFGISKALDNTYGVCGSFVGTAIYMSPERIKGDKFSFPSDVWSLGIILYELATGHSLFSEFASPVMLYDYIVNTSEPTLGSEHGYSKNLTRFLSCWYIYELK